ncbi:YbaN family protein [Erythrobacter sp. JK5]|uniref:YbaN family protein n=1 Tax=Erythrobacter sp. JK5 TaxID=2829500 RepID=UPI001BABB8FE|nr:YbaN family protein [Erythrobacter sp. JK5]QUL38082.1 YbaN family protein [Erythrobacter sp. JK5]
MRRLYLAAGLLFTGLGAIGAVLPIVPTVPFLLVAVFCFARSNPAWEQKILDHPVWGPQIEDWRQRRAINRRAKVIAIASIAAGVGFTWVTLGFPWVWISVAVLVIVGGWIATRNE